MTAKETVAITLLGVFTIAIVVTAVIGAKALMK